MNKQWYRRQKVSLGQSMTNYIGGEVSDRQNIWQPDRLLELGHLALGLYDGQLFSTRHNFCFSQADKSLWLA